MKTVNDSEQRSLLCSLLANRIQRLGSPEYPDGDDNPSESPLSVLAYRTDTSCLTQSAVVAVMQAARRGRETILG